MPFDFANIDLATLGGPYRRKVRTLPVRQMISIGHVPADAVAHAMNPLTYGHTDEQYQAISNPIYSRTIWYVHNGDIFEPFDDEKGHLINKPEPSGVFSSLYYPERWHAFCTFEEQQFGTFKRGDTIEIAEDYRPRISELSRVKAWHYDLGPKHIRNLLKSAHMYMIGSPVAEMNTQFLLGDKVPIFLQAKKAIRRLHGYNSRQRPTHQDYTDYFTANYGIGQIGANEGYISPVDAPHRSSPLWKNYLGHDWCFGRMKVFRADLRC